MRNSFHVFILIILVAFCFKWGSTSKENLLSSENATEEKKEIVTKKLRQQVADYANQFIKSKYRSAGRSPKNGFDCSGFTHYVFKKNGIKIPTNSSAQSRHGIDKNIEMARPGDLIFFKRPSAKKVFHVAMVYDNLNGQPRIIHSTSSRGVVIDDLMASPYWRSKIWKVKDVIAKKF